MTTIQNLKTFGKQPLPSRPCHHFTFQRRFTAIPVIALSTSWRVHLLFRAAEMMRKLGKHILTWNADPFAEADEDTGEAKQSQNYIHIRIQRTC